MVIKRKRSESELSFSSSSTFSSPPRPGTGTFDFSAMATPISWGGISSRASTPSGRTIKRHRDNRPSEEEVHQRTLTLLYSAQHQQPHQTREPQPIPTQSETQPTRPTQQRSLHSFWRIPRAAATPSPASSTASLSLVMNQNTPSSCEDCGAGLRDDGDDDGMMMDVDDLGGGMEDHSCGACGKTICFSCSVSNMGANRRCLVCAGRTVARDSRMGGMVSC